MSRLGISFFREGTMSVKEPVQYWLRSLPAADRKTIGADLLAVQFRWPMGKPLVDSLGDGLWELRSNLEGRTARLIFLIDDGEIVLLHGFIKKTRTTPHAALALARSRAKKWSRHESE